LSKYKQFVVDINTLNKIMKKGLKEIKLGLGLGNLKFGMSRSEVKLFLGEPTNIDRFSYTDSNEDLTETWEYEDSNLSLSFDEEEDWKLLLISVTSNFYQLQGKNLIGLEKPTLIEELQKINFGTIHIEDCSENDSENTEVIEFEEKSLNLWLNDGVLDEIQWSPFFIDDDTIKWPD